MYHNPRQRGVYGVAGTRARRVPVDYHEGTRQDFLRRHEVEAAAAARAGHATKQAFAAHLLQRTADPRTLRLAYDYLAASGGQAPGIDGISPDDLDDHEVWAWIQAISPALLHDTYRVARDRKVEIPKASGQGTRTLSIPTLFDRVVQRAITTMLQPYLDPLFDSNSFGYRPRRNSLLAMTRAERLIREGNFQVCITEDLRDAFNQIPQRRLLDICRHYIPDDGMMRLLERVVLTRTGKGIRQGGSLSPLLLNLYLHHVFDRRWKASHRDVPIVRVADDLLVLCHSLAEAREIYTDLEQMLQAAAMPLKGSPATAIRNLAGGQDAHWLGFRMLLERRRLRAYLTERAWSSLSSRLALAHTKPDAPLRAVASINGWVSAMGPTYAQTDFPTAYARITSLAHAQAFIEIPSLDEIRARWWHAYVRYLWTRWKALWSPC